AYLHDGHARGVMDAQAADLQTVTLSSDQQCVTFVVHFMGPSAGRLELDLSRVLAGRNLDRPTITIRGVYPDPDRPKKLPYRTCGSLEEETLLEENKTNTPWDLKGGVAGAGLASALLLPLLHLIACDKPINIKASWFSRPSPPPLVPLTLHRGPVHYVDRRL
ncbi:hypothetical protein O3P69_014975, partial [Scylla paramamosain]